MGYTHYVDQVKLEPAVWRRFVRHAKAILAYAGYYKTELAGPLGEGKPIADATIVSFNGLVPEAHETCEFSNETRWHFCKTARKPYDRFVGAVYLAYQQYAGTDCVSSDGDMEGDEWAPARELYFYTKGFDACPSRDGMAGDPCVFKERDGLSLCTFCQNQENI